MLLTVLILGWLAFREGIFDAPEALDQRAASLDGGVFEDLTEVGAARAAVFEAPGRISGVIEHKRSRLRWTRRVSSSAFRVRGRV